jgi:ABC-type nitrate/sulfonate/bicarbonate transport system substrate-binding protein
MMMTNHTRGIIVLVLVCILVSLHVSLVSGAAQRQEQLTIRLNWFTTVEDAGLLIQQANGAYTKAGIALSAIPYNKKNNACDTVARNIADIAIEDTALFAKCREKYPELIAFAAKFQLNPVALSVLDPTIKTPQDLKGHVVSTAHGYEVYVTIFRKMMNFSEDDLKMLQHTWAGEGMQWLIDGKTKASFDFEPDQGVALRMRGHQPRIFRSDQFGYDLYGQVYIGKRAYINTHVDLLARFLRVTEEGWRAAFANPKAAAVTVVEKYFPYKVGQTYVGSAEEHLQHQVKELMLFKPYMQHGVGHRMMYMVDAVWQRNIRALQNMGLVTKHGLATDYYTREVIKQLYRKGG